MDTEFSKKRLSHFYNKVWLFLIPYLALLAGCLTAKILYTREQIYFFFNGLHTTAGDTLAPLFTDLGDGLALVAFALIVALFSYRKSFLLLTTYGITALVAQLLKAMFDKPRPYLYFATQHDKMYLVKGVDMLSYHSFPSGHTVTAFSACITITYLYKSKYWAIPMLLLAICIGYSRMYLSQHFFEDVTAGSVVGVFVTLFWLYWFDNFRFIHTVKWRCGLLRKERQ